jgi:rhodanese-related sulfurtransferase
MEDPMKIQTLVTAFCLSIVALLPCTGYAAATTEKETKNAGFKEIHTEELKKLIDAKKPMLLFDARKKVTVGVLPGAKPLAYDASERTIAKAVGSHPKDYMIVVYCARTECPLSGYLAENLVSHGYTNVYKYPEGIEEWMKTNQIDKIN